MSKRLIPLVTWRSHEHKHHGVGDAAVRVAVAERVHLQADFVTDIVNIFSLKEVNWLVPSLSSHQEPWLVGGQLPGHLLRVALLQPEVLHDQLPLPVHLPHVTRDT